MLRLLLTALLGLCALPVLTPGPAAAAPTRKERQRAEQLNQQAIDKFKAGAYDEAADLFMQVYDIARGPAAVFNAARAKEMGQKLNEAKGLYELYLRIEKSAEGLADARQHIAAIDKAIADEAARKAAEEEAARRAREQAEAARKAAEEAARKAEAERAEVERLQAEQARQAAEQARLEAEKAAQRAELEGVTFLPPHGMTAEDTVRAVQDVVQSAVAEAKAARLGDVHPVADYIAAELQRGLPGQCDFHCQLAVARGLGSAYAVATALRQEAGQWQLRLVLWRTADGTDVGQSEVAAYTLAGLGLRAKQALGDIFNGVRRFALQPAATPPGAPAGQALLTVTAEARGAVVRVDETDRGPAPLTVALAPGPHRVRLQAAGYHARGGVVQLTPGAHRLVVALPALLPAEAQPAPLPTPSGPVVPGGQPAAAPGGATPAPAGAPAGTPAGGQPATRQAGLGRLAEPAPPGTVKVPQPGAAPGAQTPPRSSQPPAPAPPVASRNGLQWGVVGHVEGGFGLATDPAGAVLPDVSTGGGGFLHLGYGADGEPPFASLLTGVRYFQYQGLSAPADNASRPSGLSFWGGVALPRLAGLVGSLHHNRVSVENGLPDFAYNSGQIRIVSAKGTFYFAMGLEFLLSSERQGKADFDEFGVGPDFRFGIELGVNLGGVSLSR